MEYYKGIFKELKNDSHLDITEVNFYEGEYSDLYEHLLERSSYDIDFYISQGAIAGNRVLELACGTGRVGIPLARTGFDVTGIDISADMLAIYKNKLDKEMRRVKKRIRLIEGDITKIQLEEEFDLIILPATTICLFDEKMILEIFRFVKEHLSENGRFVFDWMNVNYCDFLNGAGEMLITKWKDENAYHVVQFQEFLFPDLQEVIVNMYGEIIQEQKTERTIGYTRKHIIKKEMLNNLIEQSGLHIIKEWKYDMEEEKGIEFLVLEGESYHE